MKPRLDDFRLKFRGLRSLPQRLVIFGLVALFVLSWARFLRRDAWSFESRRTGVDDPVLNNTLGFQHVFALALPERSDRTQLLLDAANATNINVTILDAVRDAQIPEHTWPIGWSDNPDKKAGELGCLTSHINTWKKMVAESIESALIMESDSDWDLRIKEIMQGVASASKRLVDWPLDTPTRPGIFPYGDKWDIIWIGHCGAWNHENHRIASVNDSTVPPYDYEYTFTNRPTDQQRVPGTRTVFPLGSACCSTAYAISNAGAVKLEKEFREGSENIDLRLARICQDTQNITCLGVWPQVITGAITKTNIEHPPGEIARADVDDWNPGPALRNSARLNAEKVLKGSPVEEWYSEWNSTWVMKNETWTMVDLDEARDLEEQVQV